MARSRTPYNSSSIGPITGPSYMDNVRDRLKDVWDLSSITLSAIGGTANAITATCDPPLTAGVTTGMKFSLIVAATNTTGATIAINGGSPINLRDDSGNALLAGLLVAGKIANIEFDGTNFRVLNTSGVIKINNVQIFTSNGTWNKPAGTPNEALVTIQIWAGGGGGGSGTTNAVSGGGGGSFIQYQCKAGDLGATVAVTIGAGGAVATAGGTSSFGSLVNGFGGGRGNNFNGPGGAGGGGGGDAMGAGGAGTTQSGSTQAPGGAAGGIMAGAGGVGWGNAGGLAPPAQPLAPGGWLGGGGGGGSGQGNAVAGAAGGPSVYGGGGGAGRGASLGGVSQLGGNGGAPGAAGQAPGGGGGSNAVGARGEVRVFVNG